MCDIAKYKICGSEEMLDKLVRFYNCKIQVWKERERVMRLESYETACPSPCWWYWYLWWVLLQNINVHEGINAKKACEIQIQGNKY